MPTDPEATEKKLASDTFKKGQLVKRANGDTGKVIRRVTYQPGDSHQEAYAVEGMVGTIPVHALKKAE